MTPIQEALTALKDISEYSHLSEYLLQLNTGLRVFTMDDLKWVIEYQDDTNANPDICDNFWKKHPAVNSMFEGVN